MKALHALIWFYPLKRQARYSAGMQWCMVLYTTGTLCPQYADVGSCLLNLSTVFEKKLGKNDKIRLKGVKDHQDPIKEKLEGEAKQPQKNDHCDKLSIHLYWLFL